MKRLRRRALLAGTGAAATAIPSRIFAQTSAAARPRQLQGVQAGDFQTDGAIVWSRSDREARMIVEYATTESFAKAVRIEGPLAQRATDYTTSLRIRNILAGQTVFYRVSYVSLDDTTLASAPVTGRFKTPPSGNRDVSFVWSADTVGQGFGINPDLGGMTIYDAMRRLEPDFFVHSGDTIYADNPLQAEMKLRDGTVWRNIVTDAKSKVAETLDEFRGNYRYNFLDDHLRKFNAEVPMLAQWDDHEVIDNWHAEKSLADDPRYKEKNILELIARANRAFREYMPIEGGLNGAAELFERFPYGPRLEIFRVDMRSFRSANGPNRRTTLEPFLGGVQVEWLKKALKASRATWKVIAAGMPLGVVVYDDWRKKSGSEAVANADDGAPLGRELEIAALLSFIKREDIRNVVWITGDVHYAATHYYDPAKATFTNFTPFHEFVAGPLCAGGFGPNALDGTFGPQVKFQKTPPAGTFNLAPSQGSCNFGHVKIDGRTGTMTVTHRDIAGTAIHATELSPA
jgi:alkaline phosphatase D